MGKTELCKALAAYMFDTEDALVSDFEELGAQSSLLLDPCEEARLHTKLESKLSPEHKREPGAGKTRLMV